ncbi:two-component system response regulator [Anaerosporomusa subterranea]|uniref:Two-component system response regulator n=1 Tax=Anaerosporomusa subterranea TaxID=1794912 RepID=A0A154BRC3_ANASB|nr:response regulator transcription factor [Anaerosporomusa subterranea]KYZ76449.1 two-component system response regulator [Anaerosporomusa subterranea]
MPITILIVDDHALLRQGIKKVLDLESDLSVIGEAADGEEAIKLALQLKPDVVLLDVNMPKKNGLEVTKELRQLAPHIKIVLLTIHDDENYVIEVVKAGATGYLLKDIEPGMLIKAIRSVHSGESFIYPTLARRLFYEADNVGKRPEPSRTRGQDSLTMREIEVLQLIGQGLSNQEMAQRLFLSEKTVKNHLTNIFRKINVSDRTQAVIYAIKHKIVQV